jgi:hypothetical protein
MHSRWHSIDLLQSSVGASTTVDSSLEQNNEGGGVNYIDKSNTSTRRACDKSNVLIKLRIYDGLTTILTTVGFRPSCGLSLSC